MNCHKIIFRTNWKFLSVSWACEKDFLFILDRFCSRAMERMCQFVERSKEPTIQLYLECFFLPSAFLSWNNSYGKKPLRRKRFDSLMAKIPEKYNLFSEEGYQMNSQTVFLLHLLMLFFLLLITLIHKIMFSIHSARQKNVSRNFRFIFHFWWTNKNE